MQSSDICLSIRSEKAQGEGPGSVEAALRLIEELRPTRIEWSYVTDRELIARFKATAPVFVATLNTIFPAGHAENFEGDPIIAPWMTQFGTPAARWPYICQNNPDDLRIRVEQAVALIADGVTDTFQFDDWYGNAQMLWYPSACFCEHCQREFARELGLNLRYRDYLRGRGFTHTAEIITAAQRGEVPLWDDYGRFQKRTVTRFFRNLRARMDQALGRPATLSVNGSVLGFGGDITTVLPFISYLNGETQGFTPADLQKLADRSRELSVRQVISFFPDVPADQYHTPAFVNRVRQAIALCYCLGLLPLFPYDVYAGNDPATGQLKPRWYGAWDEYRQPYDTIRAHPEWADDYHPVAMETADGTVTVTAAHNEDGRTIRHVIDAAGEWRTSIV